MSKRVTTKVHGELMAARKAKRDARAAHADRPVGAETEHQHPETKPAKGREHTIAKSMPPRRAAKDRPEEPIVERGITSLTGGARPAAKATPEPKRTAAVIEPADDADELVVFAFRLTRAERDTIHAAAGSAKASKFVRTLAVAAARGDGPAVLGILDTLQAKQ